MPDTITPSVGSVRNVGNMQFRWDGIRWIPTHFEGGGIGLWVNVNAPDDPVAYPLWFNPGTGGTGPAPTWDSGAAWDTQGLSWDTHGGGGVLSVWDGSAWQPVGGTQGPPGPPGEGGMTLDQAMETFLALSGGNMAGPINMQGLTITNLAPVPSATSNNAAPAAWVMQEIAATTLYQGVWQASLNIPDLSRVATHQNGFSWIAITPDPQQSIHTTATGIAGIPQGTEIFYGDHIVWSSHDSRFDIIHSSNLSLTEAEEFFVLRDGDTMEGPLYLVQPPDNPPGSLAARVDWVRDRIAEIDTGGTGPGITIPLPISQGGTEATNAEQARANLGITDTGNVVTGVSSVGVNAPLTASTNPITSIGTISLGIVPLNLGGTGVVAADNAQLLQLLGAATTDDLADYLRIDGTVPMQGPLNMNEEPIVHLALIPEEVDWAATRYWVDQEIAAIGLYQGTWQATLNIPDLRDVETHHNGFSWIILTPDPNQSAVVSVSGIAGVPQGTQVFYGEHIIWSEVNQRFDIIHAGNLSVTAAEQLFLSLTGGVMKGPINMGGPENSHQLTGLREPPPGAPDSDAATLGWVRDNYIARAGNSTAPMTGPLLLVGDAMVPTQAVPLQQLNSVRDDLLEAIGEINAGPGGGITMLSATVGGGILLNPATITATGTIGLAPITGLQPTQQYQGITFDQFGRVTSATNQNYLTGPLTSAQVTTALGFTPLQGPLTSAMVTTALGFTPLASPLTSAMVTGALGFTPLQGPLTSAMVTGALGFTPLQGPLTSAMVTDALGFMPISTVTSAMVTDALGFTPLQGPLTSTMVTTALGFTPISSVTSAMVTGALGFAPIPDASTDGGLYARQGGAWVPITTGPSGDFLPLTGGTITPIAPGIALTIANGGQLAVANTAFFGTEIVGQEFYLAVNPGGTNRALSFRNNPDRAVYYDVSNDSYHFTVGPGAPDILIYGNSGAVESPSSFTAPNFWVSGGPAGSSYGLYWFGGSPVINWHPQFWNTVDQATREWRYNTDQGTVADIAPWGRITARADIRSIGQFAGFSYQTANDATETWTWSAWNDGGGRSRTALNWARGAQSGDYIHVLNDGRIWFGWGDLPGQNRGGVNISSPDGSTWADLTLHVPNGSYWKFEGSNNQGLGITPWDYGRSRWGVPAYWFDVPRNLNYSFHCLLVDPQTPPTRDPATGSWENAFRVLNNHNNMVARFESPWDVQCDVSIVSPGVGAYRLITQGAGSRGQFWIWNDEGNQQNLPIRIRSDGWTELWETRPSDPRTKVILGGYEGGLQQILRLEPIRFRYNGKATTPRDDESVERIGVDASALLRVIPHAVLRRSDRLSDDEEPTDILSSITDPVLWALVNAVKELKAELDDLKARVH